MAAPPLGGTLLRVVAQAEYVPAGMTQTERVYSNSAFVLVASVESVQLVQDQTLTQPPSAPVTLSHQIKNTGNIPSSYTLGWSNGGANCPAGTNVTLSNLSVVKDTNSNGVADPSEPIVALGTPAALTLNPGESATLLVRGQLPVVGGGTACATLSAVTATQGAQASNTDVINLGDVAVLALYKSATFSLPLQPGSSRIDYTIRGTNIGSQTARPTATIPAGTPVLVNGTPTRLILLRDVIPAGTQYIAGSLQTTMPGALRLFRMPGDSPFAYRTTPDDASAVEVAIGLPATTGITPTTSYQMQLAVTVTAQATQSDIENQAQAFYDNGLQPTLSNSNLLPIPLQPARIGVAEAAGLPQPNPDGSADVVITVRARNYGNPWLYDVQLANIFESTGATQFGTYTNAASPAVGQFTIVPGSLALIKDNGWIGGQAAAVNPAYNGTASQPNLLAPGAVLPTGGDLMLRFLLRFNPRDRSVTLLNSTNASAAVVPGAAATVFDASVNGLDPDPDRDGNPNNNASPTPIAAGLPQLALTKLISPPRFIAAGVYDVDFFFKVVNNGAAAAPYVRVIDNLNCAFSTDDPNSPIASWALRAPVRTGAGVLAPSANFTGNVPCDRGTWAATDPHQFPTPPVLSLTDGTRALGPGQSEQVGITVRVTVKNPSAGLRTSFLNKSWAVALTDNSIAAATSGVVNATMATANGLLLDPQGTVYDAVSRAPIAGALVTVRRQSCDGGTGGAITADQLLGGNVGGYTFNADGSAAMTTGADGTWGFYLQSPPVAGKCTYSIAVTPPAGTAYIFPSQRIPPAAGSFASCGAVVPSALPPVDGQPTTYYLQYGAGFNADGSACDAVHNHIPLDPGLQNGLLLRKDASRQQVEFGDFLDYALTVTNKTGFPVTGLTFTDVLPAGFAYVPNSSRFNGAVIADPNGGAGPALSWPMPTFVLAPDQVAMVRYRVRVGVGARIAGTATNRAQVTSRGYQSNQAEQTVRVNGGVFSDEAFAFGKVYMDCRSPGDKAKGAQEPVVGNDAKEGKNGEPLEEERAGLLGVPGVRLWLEDGTNVVTDGEGRWSLYGLKPLTHVLRLDETTLPPGARVVVLDNRNSGTPSSRFLDLKKGEFQKGNFPLAGCDDEAVKKDVLARRAAAAKNLDAEMAAVTRTRLDPQGQPAAANGRAADTRGMPATGQINGSGSGAGAITPVAAGPLIALPGTPAAPGGAQARGANFLDGGTGSLGSTGTLATAQQSQVMGTSPTASTATGTGNASVLGTPAATGQVPAAGMGPQQPGQPGSVTQGLVPQPVAPSTIELEKIMPELDSTPGFIELKNGDTVASQIVNVRVKGPAGTELQLSLNGEPIDGRRVGKKATLPRTRTTAWEYIGVQLKPGANLLRLQVVDGMGIPREKPVEIQVVAPDKLGRVRIELPADARADVRTPVPVRIVLTDAAGVPVTARTQVTLESDAGRWQEEDLNPQEPGLQAFVEGGSATFHLLPPGTPGNLRIRATVNTLVQEARLTLLPELRPMIAVGIVEGTLDLTRRGRLGIDQLPAGAAFEQELSSLNSNGDTGNGRLGGRAAFFLKGAIKGEYLLTASLDTAKQSKDRLFRDIRPDEFYPVYGDSSERGYDAQSSQKLYVRIDKNRSYLLYGDFTTASSAEVRKLSQTNRTLTGAKGVYDDNGMRITGYGSRTSQQQQVEEFPGRGISGPYYLAGSLGEFVENSETVELISRDRNQPNVILKRTSLTRFVDYTLEPSTRRLMFVSPVSAVDTDLNPQSIRVTYEVDTGGPKYTVAGVDAQFKVGERLQAGVVAHVDEDPQNPRRLQAVTGLARLGENTSMAAEAVRTHSEDKGDGSASRIELRHQTERLGVSVQAARSSTGFDNPAAGFSAGHTDASARAEYRIDSTMAARAEAMYSSTAGQQDASGNVIGNGTGPSRGQSVSLLKRFNDYFSGEVGLRHGATANSSSASMFSYDQVSSFGGSSMGGGGSLGSSVTSLGTAANTPGGPGSSQNDLTTVRGRLTATLPGAPQAQVFVEGEQDVNASRRHMAAIGGSYAITDKTRVYGRYELSSTLYDDTAVSGTGARNVGIVGIESAYMEGGRVYSEYRVADADDSRTAQIANGVRNTIKLGEHWQLTGGIERSRALGTVASDSLATGLGSSTAVTSGVEYTNGALRASGILEGRRGSDANTVLNSMGMGYRLNDEWSLLARSVYNRSEGVGAQAGNGRTQSRQQLGAAYRPVADDRWNALARYEHRSESIQGNLGTAGAISGNAFGSQNTLPGDYDAHIVSAHVNYNPRPGDYLSGRLAAKRSTYDDGSLKSSYSAQLLYGRWTRDLNDKWDLSVQGGLLHGSGGALQKSIGVEVGYQVMKDLWFSVGYNAIGLSDRDLTAGEYTSKGAYFRLRFKFDETGLGFERPTSRATGSSGPTASTGTPPANPIEAPPRIASQADDQESHASGRTAADSAPTVPVPTQQLQADPLPSADPSSGSSAAPASISPTR